MLELLQESFNAAFVFGWIVVYGFANFGSVRAVLRKYIAVGIIDDQWVITWSGDEVLLPMAEPGIEAIVVERVRALLIRLSSEEIART